MALAPILRQPSRQQLDDPSAVRPAARVRRSVRAIYGRARPASSRGDRPHPRDVSARVPAMDLGYFRIWIAHKPVCRGHCSPWDCFAQIHQERPPLALVLGPRGGGKSFLSALDTHLTSCRHPGHGTRVLGGSLSQSEQVYRSLRELARQGQGADADAIAKLTKVEASYKNASEVRILPASPTSVRGPHVASLKLDEVDEINPELREAAMGMCMNR